MALNDRPRSLTGIPLATGFLFMAIASKGQTASDACSFAVGSRYTVGTACNYQNFDKPTSYIPDLAPAACGGGNNDDAFGWFTAVETSTTITYDPDGFDNAIMHIYSGACAGLTYLTCANAGGAGANETITLPTAIGTNYLVRIQRSGSNTSMDGRLCVWGPPANDNPCNATPLAVGTSCSFVNSTNAAATGSAVGAPGCAGYGGGDVWFSAVVPATGRLIIDTDDATVTDGGMALYTGTCAGALTMLQCDDNAGTGNMPMIDRTGLTAGSTVYIRFWENGNNNNGSFRICAWAPPPPPPNDNCGGAIDLPVFENCFSQTFTNVAATASGTTPAPTCGTTPSTDVWFSFVSPASGAVSILSEVGGLTDGVLQLYSGTCGSMTLVPNGCDNDAGVTPNANMPFEDRRCENLTPGATYFIRFWGYNGATGTFNICVRGVDVFVTPQQDCSGGFTVCNSGGINNNSDYEGCSDDLDGTNRGCLGTEHQGTWYFFSPQTTGNYGFSLQPVNSMGNPASIDYDFAVWGPMNTITCPPTATPLRCSYALPNQNGGNYSTGMATGNPDVSEAPSGTNVNGFTSPINVAAGDVGQYYVMYLDNFSETGQAFNLTWSLPSPTALDCSLLPVEVIAFNAQWIGDHVYLTWRAQANSQSERFVVEHSMDGNSFHALGSLDAANNSAGTTEYWWKHGNPEQGMNFYRLRLIDLVGEASYSGVVPVQIDRGGHILVPRPNPATSSVRIDLPENMGPGFSLRISDASGRIVRSMDKLSEEGAEFAELSLNDLEQGCYVVHLWDTYGQLQGTGRFVRE